MHCQTWRGVRRAGLSMDIVASILAYLGCMAGIVGALAVSFALFFSAPDLPPPIAHSAGRQSVAVTAKTATPNPAIASAAKSQAKPNKGAEVVSTVAQSTTPAPTPTASARAKMLAARAQKLRRFVQEERARRWAYQQDPDFESRFLGFTD